MGRRWTEEFRAHFTENVCNKRRFQLVCAEMNYLGWQPVWKIATPKCASLDVQEYVSVGESPKKPKYTPLP